MLSSLPNGESKRGRLRSRSFNCPLVVEFWVAGHSASDRNRVVLKDAATHAILIEHKPPASDLAQKVTWDTGQWNNTSVYLELVDGDEAGAYAWLAFGRLAPPLVALPASVADGIPANDWSEHPFAETRVVVDGIPFETTSALSIGSEGASRRIEFEGLRARHLHLLGGIDTIDIAHGSWGGTTTTANFFLGDRAGELVLGYDDGSIDRLPLVYGFNVWWRAPYRTSPEPFASDAQWRSRLDAVLHVANGLEAYTETDPMHLRLELREAGLKWIELRDDAARVGHYRIDGLTFASVDAAPAESSRFLTADIAIDAERARWFESHTIDPRKGAPPEVLEAIKSMADVFNTNEADIDEARIREVEPTWGPHNFKGPSLTFAGTPEALLLTRIYYENAQGLIERVNDETGMVHESAYKADRFDGFGGWTPDLGAYHDDAYTRLRALPMLANLGRIDKAERAITFFDKWMMYFPQSYPEIQMGGKPVPGHATVVANKPHLYFDVLKNVGWPTRFTTRDIGNPENDGHGMLMVGRYRVWAKAGRPRQWVEDRWEAIEEAADYIVWSLDNPELSLSENDLLYSETEGGMGFSVFCDTACYLGLLAYVEMAEAAGRDDKATLWRATAKRMATAMEKHHPVQHEVHGDIWNPQRAGFFFHGPLASAVLGFEYWGYDAMNRMPESWKARTERTYQLQLGKVHPSGASAGGMGYGQNFISMGALLMDRMSDAQRTVGWLARACYAPRLEHPYRVPEHFILRDGAQTWRRWGDLGNLYQLGDTVYTIMMITGIDDIRPERLVLMPRPMIDWEEVETKGNPVAITSGGVLTTAMLDYSWKRLADGSITMKIACDKPIDKLAVRLGPFDQASASAIKASIDGRPSNQSGFASGDSSWVWVEAENVRGVELSAVVAKGAAQ